MNSKLKATDFSLFGIYPKYASFIGLHAIIFFTIGVSFAKLLDRIFPKFNTENPEKKTKLQYYLETTLQIACIGIITYMIRVFVNHLIISIDILKKHIYGNPGKFADIIIAPTMFALQPNLINKIRYIWN